MFKGFFNNFARMFPFLLLAAVKNCTLYILKVYGNMERIMKAPVKALYHISLKSAKILYSICKINISFNTN